MNKCLYILILSVILASCSSRKSATITAYTPAPTVQGPAMPQSDIIKELCATASRYGSWQRMRIPVKVELAAPQSVSVSGTAVMERDKSIHISLRYFGFEIGWLYLTSDSITIADKYHKRHIAESVRPFLANVPVTVANVQDLLLGRMFAVGSSASITDKEISRGTAGFDRLYYFIPYETPEQTFGCGFALSQPSATSESLTVSNAVIGIDPVPVECSYGSVTSTKAGDMASSVTIAYQTGKTPLKATFEWNFSKAQWNSDVTPPRVKVSGYTRVTLPEILTMLKKFQ